MRVALAAMVAALVTASIAADARAQVRLANAWLRPAAMGQKATQVYLDIRASEPLSLVGASATIARGAELVLLERPDPDPENLKVVSAIPVPVGRETRLAYLGSHIRLLDLNRALMPGERIAIELTFADQAGRRQVVTTQALVRGLVVRRPDGSELPSSPAR